MPDKRIPYYTTDTRGKITLRKGKICVLREKPFTANAIVGIEVTDKPGFYDFEDVKIATQYQRWVGNTLSTLEYDETFSDSAGIALYKDYEFYDSEAVTLTTAGTYNYDMSTSKGSKFINHTANVNVVLNFHSLVEGIRYFVRLHSDYPLNCFLNIGGATLVFNYFDGSNTGDMPSPSGGTDIFEFVNYGGKVYGKYFAYQN